MNNAVLSVKGLRLFYSGASRCFQYPDISVNKGQCTSISGSIGCGKTTLLNALFRPDFPGRIECREALLSGQNIWKLGDKLYRFVSYMPQYSQDGLNPVISAGKQVQAVIAGNHLIISQGEISQLLKKLELETAILDLYPHQMSGGMKQRLVLLLAFLKNPMLMVLDEPSSAIDALTLKVILDFLEAAKSGGISLLIVSHDTGFTRHIADNSILLEGQ
jgi:ABC-type glutathione transport system ATPase component